MSTLNFLHIFIGFIGLVAIAIPFSNNYKIINYRYVFYGIVSQLLLAAILLKMAGIGIFFNILLAVFNLLPIPPLDGSRVISALLPGPLAYKYGQFEQYGFLILLGLMYIGGFQLFVLPIVNQIQLFFIAFI